MATYQVLYWFDIPLQVRAGGRRDRISKELSGRFQEGIDQVAMAAQVTGTDAYLNGFQWGESQERPGDPQEVVEAVAAELESTFDQIDWRKKVAELKAFKRENG